MTYHHTPGHPVADIYKQADLERQIEAVDFWQDEAFFHPLTCGNKSSHALLRGAERDDRAVMICPTCGYRQDLIPDVVFVAYRHRREIVRARQRFAGNRNYRSAVEEAYVDGGLDAGDEVLPEHLKKREREEEQMARELTRQEVERQRRSWQARKDAVIAAWEPVQRKMRRRVSEAREAMEKLSRSPAFLDMCMLDGVYEDELAESHGDVEDIWI